MIISFKTLGCRLNQAEEESLKRQFLEAGFWVSDSSKADLCIVNTCSVTAIADKKSRLAIRNLRNKNPKLKIIATGCGAEKVQNCPEVDYWIPNSQKENAFSLIIKKFNLDCAQKLNKKIIETYTNEKGRTRAILKVQDGCNNFCTYCIVPYLRGREKSYSPQSILENAQRLEKLGYKEIIISGVNVGRYLYRENNQVINFYKLLKLILENTNFSRIRLSSINPQDFNEKLITLWGKEIRLCRHLHLSLQSGSNSVLKRMGRPYNVQGYYSLVKRIRHYLPGVAITTDVIVGFPGETDKEFLETVDFIKKVRFAKLHIFPYSPREGTKAFAMKDQVADIIKKDRAQQLKSLGERLSDNYMNKFLNKKISVLFEEQKHEGWLGLSSNYLKVLTKTNEDLKNQIKEVFVERLEKGFLVGRLTEKTN